MENAKKVAKIEASSDETHLLLYGQILQQLRHSFRAHNMQSTESNISEEIQYHHSYIELLTEKQLSMAIYTLQATMEVLIPILMLLILWMTHNLDVMLSIAGSKLERYIQFMLHSRGLLAHTIHALCNHGLITIQSTRMLMTETLR
jgi:hypothetical protein